MKKKITQGIEKILHDSAVAELRLINNGTINKNLTYNDVLYLSIIDAYSGKYTASNIADMLFVSRPAVTQKIGELEKAGYIYKEQSASDKRVYFLHSNREGSAKEYYTTTSRTNAKINEKFERKYSEEQIALYHEMTDDICEMLLDETKENTKKG